MCSAAKEKADLREAQRILNQHLHATSANADTSNDKVISQNNSGYSLINVQWASFGIGIASIFVILLTCALCGLWFYCRRRNSTVKASRHVELLSALREDASAGKADSTPAISAPPPALPEHQWYRTPHGWCSVPVAGLPTFRPPAIHGPGPIQHRYPSWGAEDWSPRITEIDLDLPSSTATFSRRPTTRNVGFSATHGPGTPRPATRSARTSPSRASSSFRTGVQTTESGDSD